MPYDTEAVLKGLLQSYRPPQSYTFEGGIPSRGQLMSPFEQEQQDIATRADAEQRAQVDAITKANMAAIQAGFGGPTPQRFPGGWATTEAADITPAQRAASAMRQSQHQAEMAKAMAPVEAERIKQAGALDVEHARQQGYEDQYNQLMGLLRSGNLPEGTGISLHGGASLKPPTPLPAGAAAPIAKEMEDLAKKRTLLDTPGPFDKVMDYLAAATPAGTIQTTADKKAALDKAIAEQQGMLRIPAARGRGAAPVAPSLGDLRKQAIDQLQRDGYNANEANIQHVMKKLAGL